MILIPFLWLEGLVHFLCMPKEKEPPNFRDFWAFHAYAEEKGGVFNIKLFKRLEPIRMIARIQKGLLVLFAVWFITGCGMVRRTTYLPPNTGSSDEPAKVDSPSTEKEPAAEKRFSSLNEVQVYLMQAYRDWKGTPYQLGGSTQKGVDCSQFVHIVFDDYLGLSLPHTTRTLLNKGEDVRRSAIRTGDLVFFRTGRKSLHVGIAVNHGEFLHASTSSGVMISKLGSSYWRNRFLTARRVL